MKLEQRRIGEDGDAIWRPNGARQRYAKWSVEQVGPLRILLAVGFLIRNRHYSHLPCDEGICLTKEEIADYVQWLDLKELKLVHEIAMELVECGREH
jgi:hypothetical protein